MQTKYSRIMVERAETALMRRVYASRVLCGLVLLAGFIAAQMLAQVRS